MNSLALARDIGVLIASRDRWQERYRLLETAARELLEVADSLDELRTPTTMAEVARQAVTQGLRDALKAAADVE